MPEIKVPKNKMLLYAGVIGGVTALVIAAVINNAADGPRITSEFGVRAIAAFIALAGIAAFGLTVREIFWPRYLIINDKGVTSELSFGFIPWSEVVSFQSYDRVEGAGKHRVRVKGLLIKVKDPQKILNAVRGLRKFGPRRSLRLRGSPAFIGDAEWGWSQGEIAEKLQSYLTAYGKESKSADNS